MGMTLKYFIHYLDQMIIQISCHPVQQINNKLKKRLLIHDKIIYFFANNFFQMSNIYIR